MIKKSFILLLCLLPTLAAAAPLTGTALEERIATDYETFATGAPAVANLIPASDFRTPAEARFLEALKVNDPQIQVAISKLREALDVMQRRVRRTMTLQAVKVSENRFPRIDRLAKQAARMLDMRGTFNVFVMNNSDMNAFTYSYNPSDFDVVITTPLIDHAPDESLLAVIAHEMGHVKAQSVLYQVLMATVLGGGLSDAGKQELASTMFGAMPGTVRNELLSTVRLTMPKIQADGKSLPLSPVLAAAASSADLAKKQMAHFSRAAELTADRAGMIVTGGERPLTSFLLVMAFGPKALSDEVKREDLLGQIYEGLADTEASDLAPVTDAQTDHPFTHLRVLEGMAYVETDQFKTLTRRVSQSPFQKELETMVLLTARFGEINKAMQTYLTEQAELDDSYVKWTTAMRFTDQLGQIGKAMSGLGSLVLLQLKDSDLGLAENSLYTTVVDAAKLDQSTALLKTFLPSVSGLLTEQIEAAKGNATEAPRLVELNKKFNELRELLGLPAPEAPATEAPAAEAPAPGPAPVPVTAPAA